MSSSQQPHPLFVIYDRQYGTYIRLYDSMPLLDRNRYTLFDLQHSESYSGDVIHMQRQQRESPVTPERRQPQRPLERQQIQQSVTLPVVALPVVARDYIAPQSSLAPQSSVCPISLPKFVADLILRDAAAEGKLCPITMEPIEASDTFTVTPCYHAFNKEALGRWLRDHPTCPECNHRY